VVSFVPTILITGPLGSGKTTGAIDRIFPARPDDAHKTVLTERNPA